MDIDLDSDNQSSAEIGHAGSELPETESCLSTSVGEPQACGNLLSEASLDPELLRPNFPSCHTAGGSAGLPYPWLTTPDEVAPIGQPILEIPQSI